MKIADLRFQYRPGHLNLDFRSTYAFIKNPQFVPNDYETLSKLSTHEYLILTEFHNQWLKIVDFLIKAYVLRKSKLGCPGL